MMENAHIAVVEDDAEIRTLLADYLRGQGLRVDVCTGGAALDALLATVQPDLVVLDIMMPGEDGLSICRRLRTASDIPILMLTARADDVDRIVGLEMGADDYLAKPFNPRELLARIRAILRRRHAAGPRSRCVQLGTLRIDRDAREVTDANGDSLALTGAEFDLLECFLERPGRVLSRDQLMDWTRGRTADVFDRTIDVQMSRLRKKLEASAQDGAGGAPQDDAENTEAAGGGAEGASRRAANGLIKTIRNQGYILTVEPTPV